MGAGLRSGAAERIEAIEVGNLDILAAFESAAPPSRVAFFCAAGEPASTPAAAPWPALSVKLHDPDSVLPG